MFLSLCLFPRLDVACISYYRFTVIQKWKIPVSRIVLNVLFGFVFLRGGNYCFQIC